MSFEGNRNLIEELKTLGYEVEKLTPYQFRVECVLDLYPTRRRFHNIADGRRGQYPSESVKQLAGFVDAQVAVADKLLDDAIASGMLEDETPMQPGRFLTKAVEAKVGWWTNL